MVVEFLISTMNRKSFDFLNDMFSHASIEYLHILIINQTTKGQELNSNLDNIRVINSFEIGISKSRNLAIANAIGDVCVIADDDTVFVKHSEDIIKDTFLEYPKTSLIQFKVQTFCNKPFKSYPLASGKLTSSSDIIKVSSIEMVFKRRDIIDNAIQFNELFGLGSHFKSGEEFLFLNDMLKKNLTLRYCPKAIVKHSLESTTIFGSDDYIRAKSAIYFITYKKRCFFYVLKLLFLLKRKGIIRSDAILAKYTIAKTAIKDYKNLI